MSSAEHTANTDEKARNIELRAVGTSRGIAIGKAFILERRRMEIPRSCILENAVEEEIERFERALERSKAQLKEIIASLSSSDASQHLYVLEAHRKMLDDPMVEEGTKQGIRQDRINAEWALIRVLDEIAKLFSQVEDDYLRERAADVDFIGHRILRNLSGAHGEQMPVDARGLVAVAHDLSPADVAQLAQRGVVAIAVDVGGRTGHTAIMSRSLGLPAVVGLGKITKTVNSGDTLIVDGTRGLVVVRPDQDRVRNYEALMALELEKKEALAELKDLPAVTTDGTRVKLLANIDLPSEVHNVTENGAEGVGLFRTEYLFIGRNSPPTEEEHYAEYMKILEHMDGRPVTLRTYDLGGEKLMWLESRHMDPNPALGLRGVRFTLKHEDLLVPQLKAMLRAGAHGDIRILFPMVSGLKEWRRIKGLVEKAKSELEAESAAYNPTCALGPMIEIPSAAIVADQLAREADFLSLGTNDLVQYMLAADRDNELISDLYEPMHPSILRTLNYVIGHASKAGVPLSICGEMAGDPMNAMVLLGLGLQELSMTPSTVPVVKMIVRNGSKAEASQLAQELLKLSTAEEVSSRVLEWMSARFPDLL